MYKSWGLGARYRGFHEVMVMGTIINPSVQAEGYSSRFVSE